MSIRSYMPGLLVFSVIIFLVGNFFLFRYGLFRWEMFRMRTRHYLSERQHKQLQRLFVQNKNVLDDVLLRMDRECIPIKEREITLERWLHIHRTITDDLATCALGQPFTNQVREKFIAGEFEQAAQILQQAAGHSLMVKTSEKQIAAAFAFTSGTFKELQFDYPEAKASYQQALQLAPQNRKYLKELSYVLSVLGQHEEALECLTHAFRHDLRKYGSQHPLIAEELNSIARIQKSLGQPEKAIASHEQALAMCRQLHGNWHVDVAITLYDLGETFISAGQFENAIENFSQAIEIFQKIHEKYHPKLAMAYHHLGILWGILPNAREQAVTSFKNAIAVNRKIYGAYHPKLTISLTKLGELLKATGKPREAISSFKHALTIDRIVYTGHHPDIARDLNNLGLAYMSLRKYRKSLTYFSQTLAIERVLHGEQHRNVATSLDNLGRTWSLIGDSQKALSLLLQAEKIIINESGMSDAYAQRIRADILDIQKRENLSSSP